MSGVSIKRFGRNFSIRLSLFYVLRGIFLGLILTFLFNIRKLDCLRSKDARDEIIMEEPTIPEKFLNDLLVPKPPLSDSEKYLKLPWRILKPLEDAEQKYYIIVLMRVMPFEPKRRYYARSSWGSVEQIDGKRIGLIFLMGRPTKKSQDNLLMKENDLYGDILEIDLDTKSKDYTTLLTLSGHQWCIETIGKRSDYYVNVMSDILVLLPNVFNYCQRIDKSTDKDLFHCGVHITNAHYKVRNPASPFYVPDSIYPNSVYPSYCDADMVIQHQSLLHKLHETALKTDQGNFPIERVYVWGILREKLRAGGKKNLILYKDFMNKKAVDQLSHQFEIANSMQCKNDLARLWRETKQNLNIESKPGGNNEATHKGVIWDLPSMEKKAMEKTMKLYIYRWGRIA